MMSRLLAWITSLVLLLAVVEGITRLMTPAPATEPDPVLGWAYKAKFHQNRSAGGVSWDLRTNSQRLRAPEGHGFGAKQPGETRILILGDSFTVGWALEADQTFAARLEALCNEKGRNVTVIPGATEAWYTDQECIWFERNVAEIQPDILIICPYANDVVGNALPRYLATNKPVFPGATAGMITGDAPAVSDDRPWWLAMSRLASTVNTMRLGMQSQVAVPLSAGGGRLQLDDFPFLKTETPEVKAGYAATGAIAARIAARAKSAGIRAVFAAPIPNKFEIHKGDGDKFELNSRCAPGSLDYAGVTTRLATVFASAGFQVIDAKAALVAAGASERVYFEMPNEWHFNEKGAAIFAGALAAGIENALPAAGAPRTGPVGLSLNAVQHQKTGLFSPWALVSLGTLWLLLSIGFKVAYPDENPLFVFVKIALLLAVVVSLFMGIGWLTGKLPPLGKVAIFGGLIIALATYGLYKTAPRLGTIRELFGALVDRGHWYLVPMLVVMLAISILLVVAQNPIVAPFIYTLF